MKAGPEAFKSGAWAGGSEMIKPANKAADLNYCAGEAKKGEGV